MVKQITPNISSGKAIIWGIVAIVLQMGVYYIIWMNPWVNDIVVQYENHSSVKSYDYFGGLENWFQLRLVYNIVILATLILLFLMFYDRIPGKGWLKGLYFGLILAIIKVIPSAFNTWTLITYPEDLIMIQMINGSIGYIIFGNIISFLFHHFKVIQSSDS